MTEASDPALCRRKPNPEVVWVRESYESALREIDGRKYYVRTIGDVAAVDVLEAVRRALHEAGIPHTAIRITAPEGGFWTADVTVADAAVLKGK